MSTLKRKPTSPSVVCIDRNVMEIIRRELSDTLGLKRPLSAQKTAELVFGDFYDRLSDRLATVCPHHRRTRPRAKSTERPTRHRVPSRSTRAGTSDEM